MHSCIACIQQSSVLRLQRGSLQGLGRIGHSDSAWLRHTPMAMLVNKRDCTLCQVPYIISQIAVESVNKSAMGKVAVTAERDLRNEEITQWVPSMDRKEGPGIKDITQALAHLFAIFCPPTMRKNSLRWRESCCKQKGRPVDAVKAQDIFPYHMQRSWPKPFEWRSRMATITFCVFYR